MHRNWCVSALIWDRFGIVSDFENTYEVVPVCVCVSRLYKYFFEPAPESLN